MTFHSCAVAVGLCALGMIGAGCASAPKLDPNMPKPSATVKMNFHSFSPKSVTIEQGQSVLWHNSTLMISHTVTDDSSLAQNQEDAAVPAGAKEWNSGKISAGKDYERVFTVPGTYKYFCIPHESNGMVGEVIVEPAK